MSTLKPPPEIRRVDPCDVLREAIKTEGSAAAVARRLGISTAYVCDVRHGRRPASGRLLTALGLQRVVVEAARG